jgi:hypothetical protein
VPQSGSEIMRESSPCRRPVSQLGAGLLDSRSVLAYKRPIMANAHGALITGLLLDGLLLTQAGEGLGCRR